MRGGPRVQHALVALLVAAAATGSAQAALQLAVGGAGGFFAADSAGTAAAGVFGDAAAYIQPPAVLATRGNLSAACVADYHACGIFTPAAIVGPNFACWSNLGAVFDATAQPTLSNVAAVRLACGGKTTCIIDGAGQLTCWRLGGQLLLSAAVGVGASVAVGGSQVCYVTSPGLVVNCTTTNPDSWTGAGTIPFPAIALNASTRMTTQVALGGGHGCVWGTYTSGTPFQACWGANGAGQATIPTGASTMSQICCGAQHSCGVVVGVTMCWGSGEHGATAVPQSATDGSVLALACGARGACALKTAGSIVCWGEGLAGSAARSPGVPLAITTAGTTDLAGVTGPLVIASGGLESGVPGDPAVDASQASGRVVLASGAADSDGASSGGVELTSGTASIAGVGTGFSPVGITASGPLLVSTGSASGAGGSGSLIVAAGAAPLMGGSILLSTGPSPLRTGAVSLLPGAGGSVVATIPAAGSVAFYASTGMPLASVLAAGGGALQQPPALVASDAGVYVGSAAAGVRRARLATLNVTINVTASAASPQLLALNVSSPPDTRGASVGIVLESRVGPPSAVAAVGGPVLALRATEPTEGALFFIFNKANFGLQVAWAGAAGVNVTRALAASTGVLVMVARCASGDAAACTFAAVG